MTRRGPKRLAAGALLGAAVIVAVLLARSTTTAPGGLAPARPPPTGEQFGASVNLLFNSATNPPQQIAVQLEALRRTGATIARSDALWEATEPAAPVHGVHHYVWTFDDTIAGALAAHHLRWLPIIDYTAPWAQSIPGQDHSPPASVAGYAAYASAFAARYGPGGRFWREHPTLSGEPVQTYEIWNEPDSAGFWLPAADAAHYADLYIAARRAIDAVQPDARVIVGGLADHPTTFIPAMLTARPQLRGHVDGVGLHPYGVPFAILGKIKATRATLVSLGMGSVPLYVTEFGWTTSPPGALWFAPTAQRTGYISSTVAGLGHLNCGLAMTIIYTWFSPQQNPGDPEQWYGLDGTAGTPTPATMAFANAVRGARERAATVALCP